MEKRGIITILSLLLTFCIGCYNNSMYKSSIIKEPSVDSFSMRRHTYIGKQCPIDTNLSKSIKKCILLHDTLIVIVDKDGLFNNKILKAENVDTLYNRFSQRYECIDDTTILPIYFLGASSLDSMVYIGYPSTKNYVMGVLSIKDPRFIYDDIIVGMTKKELFSLFDYPLFPITNYSMAIFISSGSIDGFISLYPPRMGVDILIVNFKGNRISQFRLQDSYPTDSSFFEIYPIDAYYGADN